MLELASQARRNDIEKCWEFDKPLRLRVKYWITNFQHEREVKEEMFDVQKLFLNCFFDDKGRSRPYWSVISYEA